MKIEGGRRVSATGAKPAASASAAPGFTPELDAPERSVAVTAPAAVAALDAVLALQTEEPAGRRLARQAKRGRDALDALEELERALLNGRAPQALRGDIERLRHAAEPSGDEGLDGVLKEIDIRLAVEAAKLDRLLGRT